MKPTKGLIFRARPTAEAEPATCDGVTCSLAVPVQFSAGPTPVAETVWLSETSGNLSIRSVQGDKLHTISGLSATAFALVGDPADHNTTVWVGCADGSVRVMNPTNASEISCLPATSATVTSMTAAVQVGLVFISGGDAYVTGWDVDALRPLLRLRSPADVTALHFDHYRSNLLSAGVNGSVFVWPLAANVRDDDADAPNCAAALTGHVGPVRCLSSTSTAILSGGDDGSVRVWDVDAGVERHTITALEEPVVSMATAELAASRSLPPGVDGDTVVLAAAASGQCICIDTSVAPPKSSPFSAPGIPAPGKLKGIATAEHPHAHVVWPSRCVVSVTAGVHALSVGTSGTITVVDANVAVADRTIGDAAALPPGTDALTASADDAARLSNEHAEETAALRQEVVALKSAAAKASADAAAAAEGERRAECETAKLQDAHAEEIAALRREVATLKSAAAKASADAAAAAEGERRAECETAKLHDVVAGLQAERDEQDQQLRAMSDAQSHDVDEVIAQLEADANSVGETVSTDVVPAVLARGSAASRFSNAMLARALVAKSQMLDATRSELDSLRSVQAHHAVEVTTRDALIEDLERNMAHSMQNATALSEEQKTVVASLTAQVASQEGVIGELQIHNAALERRAVAAGKAVDGIAAEMDAIMESVEMVACVVPCDADGSVTAGDASSGIAPADTAVDEDDEDLVAVLDPETGTSRQMKPSAAFGHPQCVDDGKKVVRTARRVRTRLAEVHAAAKRLRTTLDVRTTEARGTAATLKKVEAGYELAEESIRRLKSGLQRAEAGTSAAAQDVAEREAVEQCLRATVATKDEEVMAASLRLERAEEGLATKDAALQRMIGQMERMRRRLGDTQEAAQRAIAAKDDEVAALRQRLSMGPSTTGMVAHQMATSGSRLASSSRVAEEIHDDIQCEVSAVNDAARQQIAQLDAEIARLESRRAEMQGAAAARARAAAARGLPAPPPPEDIGPQIAHLSGQRTLLQRQLAGAGGKPAAWPGSTLSPSASAGDIAGQVAALSRAATAQSSCTATLRAQTNTLRTAWQLARRRLTDSTAYVSSLHAHSSKLTAQVVALQNALRVAHGELAGDQDDGAEMHEIAMAPVAPPPPLPTMSGAAMHDGHGGGSGAPSAGREDGDLVTWCCSEIRSALHDDEGARRPGSARDLQRLVVALCRERTETEAQVESIAGCLGLRVDDYDDLTSILAAIDSSASGGGKARAPLR